MHLVWEVRVYIEWSEFTGFVYKGVEMKRWITLPLNHGDCCLSTSIALFRKV